MVKFNLVFLASNFLLSHQSQHVLAWSSTTTGSVISTTRGQLLSTFGGSYHHHDKRINNNNNNSRLYASTEEDTTTKRSSNNNNDFLEAVREGIKDANGEDAWKESITILVNTIDIDKVEAETILSTAYKWKAWSTATPLMRKWMKPTIPDTKEIQDAINWLTLPEEGPLQLTKDQLRTAIRHSPKVYLSNPNKTYKLALKVAPKHIISEPSDFKDLILKDPSILQCTFNCSDMDGCASECGSCWVTYEKQI